jgi:hypothetical protein
MPQCQFPDFAIFVFQKSYTENIHGIGWNKSQNSYISWSITESKAETKGSQEVAAPCHSVGPPGHARLWCGPLAHTLTPPFRLYIPPRWENLKPRSISIKHTASRHRRRCEIGRAQKLFSAPCRRGESPPKAFFITMPSSGVMRE